MGVVEPVRPGGGYAPPPYPQISKPPPEDPHSTWVYFVVPPFAIIMLISVLIYVIQRYNHMSRHGGRYSYSALEDDGSGGAERLEMDRKMATISKGATRDTVGMAARAFCRTQPRYSLAEHLHEVGSRIDKNWFIIRDISVKTERLMTLLPVEEGCPIAPHQTTKEALVELFQALQHPYIYPVLDIDFMTISPHTYVVTIIPHNNKGSLKDLIYKSQWKDDWQQKYQQRATGLPVKQVQRLGRQILEALLYLQDRGFPPSGHIHSGNIILQNGVARISGLENTLLGLTSRIYPIIRRRLKENRDAIDSVCFGHVLFEMCAGYELSSAHPTPKHLEDISAYPQVVSVLEYIFGFEENYPSVEEILCCDFFRNLDLREMRAMPLPPQYQLPYSAPVRAILKDVRRHQKQKRRVKHPTGTSTNIEGGSTPTSSEASTSGGAATAEETSGATGRLGGGGGVGGAYSSPSKSSSNHNAVLQQTDASPSPEHSAHRNLGIKSPQRKGAITPSSPEIFHTPPLTPPTVHHHYNHSPKPSVSEHDHYLNKSTTTISISHNARPLGSSRHNSGVDSLSNTAFEYLESRARNLHNHHHHHHRSKSPLLSPHKKSSYHSSLPKSPLHSSKIKSDMLLSPYYTPKHNTSSQLTPNDTLINLESNSYQMLSNNNQIEQERQQKRGKT